MTNAEEYAAGTHPLDAGSTLRLLRATLEDARLQLEFLAVAGRSYSLLWTPALDAPWVSIAEKSPQVEDSPTEFTVDPVSDPMGFYRLVTPAQP